MAWFKVDDKLWGHPKWLALPMRARGLWVTAGSWSAANETDGKIPRHVVRTLGGTAHDAAALVEVGMWREARAGWVFHEWGIYQPDAASLKARRSAEVEGGILGNHRRWHLAKNVRVPDCPYCQGLPPDEENEPQLEYRVPDEVPDSPPTPPGPDPTRPDTRQVGGGGNVRSDETQPPPPIEPWRCQQHQGVDTPCLACKAAKDQHKASEDQRKRDTVQAKRDAENTRRQAALAERAEAETEALRDPVQIHALIESALHPKEVDA